MAFNLSQTGRETLKSHEGVVPYVYDDRRGARYKPTSWSDFQGYPTIGMGRLIQPSEFARFTPYLNGNRMPDSELAQLIEDTIRPREVQLNKLVGDAPITQSMFDALFSLMYNTGSGNSSFRAAINALTQRDSNGKWAPDYVAAQAAIANGPTTSKGKLLAGLVRRRQEEAARFIADGLPGGASSLLKSKTLKIGVAIAFSALVASFFVRRSRRRK
jgi:GH24 family phage-related lysozyme (muramidase)